MTLAISNNINRIIMNKKFEWRKILMNNECDGSGKMEVRQNIRVQVWALQIGN